MFFWKLSSERMFCWSRHVRGCFAENRHMVFFWTLSWEEGACDVLLKWMFERTSEIGKYISITQQTVDNALALVSLAFLVDLHLSQSDFIEKNAPKNFSWYSGGFWPLLQPPADWPAETRGFFWIEPLLPIHVWCSASGLDCWQQRLESPQRTTSKQVQVPLLLLTSLPPLPLFSGL